MNKLIKISTILVVTIGAIATFVPSFAFATNQAAFSSQGMFMVGDHAQAGTYNWTTQLTNMHPGDQVAFKFTFLNTSSVTAIDAKSSFSATNSGNCIQVIGTIWAQNAPSVSQSVSICAASGYTISLSQTSASFGGVGDVLPGSNNIEYYATGLYSITGQSIQQNPTANLWAEYPNSTTVTQVPLGTAPYMHWSSTNASECHVLAGAGFSTGNATQGQDVVSPLAGTTTFSIQCTNTSGGSIQANYTVHVTQPALQPTANLSANPTTVNSGGASTLTWSSTNASECHATGGGFSTGGATSGSVSTGAIYSSTTYSIACSNTSGSAANSVTVSVNTSSLPTATISANPTTVNSGGTSYISWTSTNASECHATQGSGFSTGGATSGSDISSPLYSNTTFSISCSNPAGLTNNSVVVYVNSVQSPTVHISAYPSLVSSGQATTIQWTSTNASECHATQGSGFSTGGATSGSDISSPLYSNTVFSVNCSNAAGSNTESVTVSVNTAPPSGTAPTAQTITAGNISQTSATLNGSVNPNQASTTYWFEYGTSQSLGNSTSAQSAGSGSGSINVSAPISSLTANTTYYFRIVAQNNYGTVQGSILSFTTSNNGGGNGTAPTAQTITAGNISQTSATLNGSVNPNQASTTYWFEYGTSQSLGNSTSAQSAGSGSGSINVSAPISSLTANTTYYFRIVAQNNYGTVQGSILSFTTSNNGGGNGTAPTAQTITAGNISQTSATLNGSVNPNQASTTYWFEYGTSQSLGNSTSAQSAGSGSGSINVSAPISSLTANTTYYFRIVAQNNYGTVQGSILSFTTSNNGGGNGTAPTAQTITAGNISQTSATLNGSVNPNQASTTYWFEYGTSQSLGNSTSAQSAGSGSGSINVSAPISSLTANTTYYFRIVAQNNYGTVQGSILSFTTSNNGGGNGTAPTAQTITAGNISQTSATLNGSVNPNQASTTYWFEYGTSQSLGNSTSAQSAGSGSGSINVSAPISSLTANTTYYFRIVAQNNYGTVQGSILSFTTSNNGNGGGCTTPYVQTIGASNTYQSSAQLNGSVNPNNCQTSYWFEYGPSYGLGSTTGYQSAGSGNGTSNISTYVSNLNYNGTYYFRAVAQNSAGIAYGSILSFSTGIGGCVGSNCGFGSQPNVQTYYATNLYNNSANLNGSVMPNNYGSDSTYAWFEYGTNMNLLTMTTNSTYIGSGNYSQNFSQTIYNLSSNTTYYYRAAARNSYGTAYGQILSLNTNTNNNQTGAPQVITNDATYVFRNSALLNGQADANGISTNAWFEYGTTMNLGSRTNDQPIGASNDYQNYSSALTGLSPNTTYYFRAAAQNNSGTAYGSILSFKTSGGGTIVVPSEPQTIIVRTVTTGQGLSCFVLVPSLNVSELTPGNSFTLTITYRNGCDYNLSNVFLKVILPPGTDFVSTNYPFFNRDANGLSYNLGAIPSGFQSAISIGGIVSNSVNVGDSLIFSAVINYNDVQGKFQSISSYLTAIVGSKQALGATVLEAIGNLLGNWIFDLILVIAILFSIYWIFLKKRDEDTAREDDILEAKPLKQ